MKLKVGAGVDGERHTLEVAKRREGKRRAGVAEG